MFEQVIVWHLISNRWNSAITEYALSAARSLKLRGHDSVFTPLVESPAEARAKLYGLKVESLPHFGIGQVGAARAMQARLKPDVIMTYGGPETTLTRFLPSETRVFRFRGQDHQGGGLLDGLRASLSHGHVEALVVPSEHLLAPLKSILPSKSAHVVALGCDTEKFHRKTLAHRSTRPELLILGRLDPVKGHGPFFEVFAEMLKSWPGDERPLLTVVGEPANLSVRMLEESAKSVGLEVGKDVVFRADRVGQVAELLSNVQVGVVSSIGSEVIVRVAEEFLLCGTPIFVSGVGSLESVLFADAGASYRGLPVEASAQLLKQWIQRSVSESEADKQRRAEAAKARFDFEKMGETLEAVFQRKH